MRASAAIHLGGLAALSLVSLLGASPAEGGARASQSTPGAGAEAGAAEPPAALVPATEAQLIAQRVRSEATPWGRDPFARPRSAVAPERLLEAAPVRPQPTAGAPAPTPRPEPLPRLGATSARGAARWALIDRTLVREGDVLSSGFAVASIGHRTVTLLWEGEELVLHLGDGR